MQPAPSCANIETNLRIGATDTFAYRRMPNYTLLEYICEDNREYADERGVQRIRVGEPAKK